MAGKDRKDREQETERRGWGGATRPRQQLWRHRERFKELGVGRSSEQGRETRPSLAST